MSRFRTIGVMGAWVALAGCSDPTGPGPVTPLDRFVLEMLRWQEFMMPAYIPASHNVPRVAACAYDDSTDAFLCPPAHDRGLTLSLQIQLLDANGGVLRSYDSLVVDAVRIVTHVQGQYTNSGDAVALVEARQDHTMRGLLGEEALMSGGGSMSHDWSRPGESTSGSSTQVITDLALPISMPAEGLWIPRSGTIVVDRQYTGSASAEAATGRTVLTFLGTVVARLERIANGVTQHCTWDFTPRHPEAGNGITCEPPGS